MPRKTKKKKSHREVHKNERTVSNPNGNGENPGGSWGFGDGGEGDLGVKNDLPGPTRQPPTKTNENGGWGTPWTRKTRGTFLAGGEKWDAIPEKVHQPSTPTGQENFNELFDR